MWPLVAEEVLGLKYVYVVSVTVKRAVCQYVKQYVRYIQFTSQKIKVSLCLEKILCGKL